MKPIIFVRVADMKYYQGITESDKPLNGGSYVNETGYAHECYNFAPVMRDGENHEKCLGWFRMMGGRGAGQLHIENIVGCGALKEEGSVDGVIVVFVSKAERAQNMRAVGFYKNAKVYRTPQYDDIYDQEFMFEARKEDCVVLPYSVRFSNNAWYVPNNSSKYAEFGFGRSNVWYAGGKGASRKELDYVERMIKSVDDYAGANWINEGGDR